MVIMQVYNSKHCYKSTEKNKNLWRFSKANIKQEWKKVSVRDENSFHVFYAHVKRKGERDQHHHIGEKERSVSQNQRCVFVWHMRVWYACSGCRY